MIELYECEEPECDALLAYDHLRKPPIYCRWHHVRPRPSAGPAVTEPIRRGTDHVSDRVGTCFYCGMEENLTRDHVIPKSEGKQFKRPWNTVWCCEWCNQKKANMQLAEWLLWIDGIVSERGWHSVHTKHQQVLARSRSFISHLLTDPSHSELKSYRKRVDPWFGRDPRATLRSV